MNSNWGIYLSDLSNSSVLFNNIHLNSNGLNLGKEISAIGSDNNSVSYNNISYNTNSGLTIYGNNQNFTKNNISNNGNGVTLQSGQKNTLEDNIACKNTNKDFYCISGSNTFGTGNQFTSIRQCDGVWPQFGSGYVLCPFPVDVCRNFVNDDGDTGNLIDMADADNPASREYCPSNLCAGDNPQLTYPVAGNVNTSNPPSTKGVPWNTGVNPNKIPNIAWCCPSNQCFFNGIGCQPDGFRFANPPYDFVCSVNGNSAVWCNTTFVNNGTGYCECPNPGTLYDSVTGKCLASGGICNFNGRCETDETFCSCQSDCYDPKIDCTGISNLPLEEDSFIPELVRYGFCSDKSLTFEVGPDSCGTYTKCSCWWDTNNSRCLERTEKAETIQGCIPGGITEINLCLTDVGIKNSPGSCEQGGADNEIIWNSTFQETSASSPISEGNPEKGCASGSKPLPCPVITKLPFFTLFSLMISLGVISVIYFVFRKRIKFVEE